MDISMSLDLNLHILEMCLVKMPLLACLFKRKQGQCYKLPTIGDKIVETLYSNRVTSEKKESTPLPSIQCRGVRCFLLVTRTAAQH